MSDQRFPEVGARFTYKDVEYVINRFTINRDKHDGEERPVRIQIDAMSVDEVYRRKGNLEDLLEGIDRSRAVT